jgi:hypothetical protein
MDEPLWWPQGVIQTSYDSSFEGELVTSLGRLKIWNFKACLELEWWQAVPETGKVWGKWPEVKNLEVIQHDRYGILLNLNGTHIVRICPFEVGNDISRMLRHQPWNEAVSDQALMLPSMVWSVAGNDRVIIYPCKSLLSIEESHSMKYEIAECVGLIHSSLDQFSTPNTERIWNDRLKDIEACLKTNTLWRAPHSKFTVGLPRLNLDIGAITMFDDKPMMLPQPRTITEHLMCDKERLPGLATMMILERQWSAHEKPTEESRKQLLESWLSGAPQAYSNGKALSTLLGGPWVWRYHATLLELGQAMIFSDSELEKNSIKWLSDVSRLQAYLGILRFWKSGLWGGVTGLIVSFFTWQLETLSPTVSGLIGATSILFALASNQLYWSKDPDPY